MHLVMSTKNAQRTSVIVTIVVQDANIQGQKDIGHAALTKIMTIFYAPCSFKRNENCDLSGE